MKLFRRSRTDPAHSLSQRPSQPIETGIVTWIRSLDQALHQAGETTKPVFALFQEVPGCAGCQQFGADVLSDPRIVDAIEHEFVPLLIHNNSPGPDAEVLAHYGEPAWNFQVVRFFDAHGSDLIERRDRIWHTGPLAARMIRALAAHGQAPPPYLQLIEQEHSDRLAMAYLAQPCFWVGEMELGQIAGVVTTEAGFLDGHEVTKVVFDPDVLPYKQLITEAQRRGVAHRVFAHSTGYRCAPAHDQKRQLGNETRPGLSPAQLTKLNAFVRTPLAASSYLSPSQR